MHAAGVTVIIAKFQWVGVMHGAELTTDGSAVHSDHTNTTTATDTATAAAAAADDDDDGAGSASAARQSSPVHSLYTGPVHSLSAHFQLRRPYTRNINAISHSHCPQDRH